MSDRERCAYLPGYDCRCNDPVYCPIIQEPPGTYPLRVTEDRADNKTLCQAEGTNRDE